MMEIIATANRASRELAICGLKMRFPNDFPERTRRRLASLWFGEERTGKVYGPFPPMNRHKIEPFAANRQVVATLKQLEASYHVDGSAWHKPVFENDAKDTHDPT